jgi:arsenical pump membrane protein
MHRPRLHDHSAFWFTALRREGLTVNAWTFLKLGVIVMPPALLLAVGATLAFD